jgi:hypothetical protein
LIPTTILRVEGVDGQLWLDWSEPRRRPLVSAPLAYLMVDMLSDESARWPSLGHPNPLEIGRPALVKAGQSAGESASSGVWAVGATPQLTVGVWLGADTDQRLAPASAAGLWHAVTQYALRSAPAEAWKLPQGVTQKVVCDPSGLLPTAECPSLVEELFLAGNEPAALDSLYRKFPVNRENGRLATVFTPAELVITRIYLVTPLEASQWARLAGQPTPPEAYDFLPGAFSPSPQVRLASPEFLAHVGGVVEFRGSAAGDDFSYYRLQIGAGLNPQRWLQVGLDVTTPITDGVLGTLDTNGLQGLYAVQLLVVRKDQRVETAISQITVDNQPPTAVIRSPGAGERLTSGGKTVLFQVDAADDVSLSRVELWVDGELLAVLYEPPFLLAWKAAPGAHRLEALAFDRAGNVTGVEAPFEVEK